MVQDFGSITIYTKMAFYLTRLISIQVIIYQETDLRKLVDAKFLFHIME